MKPSIKLADPVLFGLAFVATLVGTLAIFDAGYARSIQSGGGIIPREFRMQLLFSFLGLGTGYVTSRIPLATWRRRSTVVFGVTALLVFALLVPIWSINMNGATRWIDLGPVMIQPSEFAKVGVVVFLAGIFAARPAWRQPRRIRDLWHWLDQVGLRKLARAIPALLVLVVAVKIEREPDLGTAAVILAILGAMMVLGGVSGKSLALCAAVGIVGAYGFVRMEPYRLERITSHAQRWESQHMDDVGYQTVQSETAIASGGLTGVGIGSGRAKYMLPAATTDFITSTIGEETGLVGSWLTLGLLGGLTWRLFWLAKRTKDAFGSLVCAGIGVWFGMQATVNVMMANGTFPPIGIPLPFFSSGGSSLIALWWAVGLAMAAAAAPATLTHAVVEADVATTQSQRRPARRGRVALTKEDHATDRHRRRDRRTYLSRP